MTWHYLEKEFYDYADDIEAVNIHYVWTPLGGTPDWDTQRITRFMPLVKPTSHITGEAGADILSSGVAPPTHVRLRKKVLKLPAQIPHSESGKLTDRYLLHHYFEIFQDGHRHYSPLYTEEITTGAGTQPLSDKTVDGTAFSQTTTVGQAGAKEWQK